MKLLIIACLTICIAHLLFTKEGLPPTRTNQSDFNSNAKNVQLTYDYLIKKEELCFDRMRFLGGAKYNSLLSKHRAIMRNSLMNNGFITLPTQKAKDAVNKELREIFWYYYWLNPNYLQSHFWGDCVFNTLDSYLPIHESFGYKVAYLPL